jgi:uncharacterized protein
MKEFSLLIKPSSADCNMNCNYCFYLKKSSLYPEEKIHRMTEATLEKLISHYMETPQTYYTFSWQGGEPTLMGLKFFKKVVEFQKNYGKAGSLVANGLQTNGTLIDNALAKYLSEYKFLLGVSLDGPEYLHDNYRKFLGGQGTFKKVMRGIRILKDNDVKFNILTLVNDFNVDKAAEVYKFLVKRSLFFHQYIPCVEFDSQGNLQPFSINGEQWGNFLINLFNQWYPQDIHKVSIRLFDSILNYLIHGKSTICHMTDSCNQYLVVEYNGDIYPCDFFVMRDLKLGNIHKDSWKNILNSITYLDFGKAKSDYSFLCNFCPYLNYCYGDCLKHRNFYHNSAKKLSILCSGWRMFYKHSLKIFEEIATDYL